MEQSGAYYEKLWVTPERLLTLGRVMQEEIEVLQQLLCYFGSLLNYE